MRSRRGFPAVIAVIAAIAAGAWRTDAQVSPRFRKHIAAFGQVYSSAVALDLDRDGRPEIVAASPDALTAYTRGPRPSFWRPAVLARATAETGSLRTTYLQPFDLDGDGDLDVVAHHAENGHLAWYQNPGSAGDWTRRLIDTLPGVHHTAFEDLNRDGRPELIANHEGAVVWYPIPRSAVTALPASYRGDPAGRLLWERRTLSREGVTGVTHYMAFGDVDGDGDRDLCTGAAEGNYLAYWERPPDGTLHWTRQTVRTPAVGATHLVPADLNGDGKPELVYSLGHGTGIGYLSGQRWRDATIIDADWVQNPHCLALADLDGDGDLDLASAGHAGPQTGWWENDGKGVFTRRELDRGQHGIDLRAQDLDGDGDLDLLQAGEESRNLVWWENLRL